MTAGELAMGWVLVPALLFVAFLCVIIPGAVVAFVGDRLEAIARRYLAVEPVELRRRVRR